MILANVIQSAFSPLISVFESILVFIHSKILGGASWGLAIIGLTVFIRALMVPLTFSQFKSMQNMQRHMPELKALQLKYKDDKQRQQQEMMKFYRENKVNPFASCLPLVLQLPVFISLFYMLRKDLKVHICGPALTAAGKLTQKAIESTSCNSVAPNSAKFLFIPDITHQATGVVLILLLVLYVGSQLASTMLMSTTADPNQRRLMMALPLVFVLFVFKFPAGLLVYWITTNVWTVGQQYLIRRGATPPPVAATAAATGKGGAGSSPPTPARAETPAPSKPSGGSQASPALAGAANGNTPATPPPRPPRKKKKRSGRRR